MTTSKDHHPKLAVQTFTVRNLAQKDLKKTLDELKLLGIKNIELAYIEQTEKNIKIIQDSNLKVVSMQLTLKILKNNFNDVVHHCKTLKCKRVIVSVMPVYAIIGKTKSVIKLGKQLDILKDKYNKEHIDFAYHHHDFEFKKIKGKSKLDILLENTSQDVKFVTDTYWTAKSKLSPSDIITKFGKRLMGVHIRDLSKLDFKTDCEIGSGSIDFNKVLTKAGKYASYVAIEQNTKTPLESLKQSITYINEHYQNLIE